MSDSRNNSGPVLNTRTIAARATLSGFSQAAYHPLNKKATKFIVTLKPVQKLSEQESVPINNSYRCDGKIMQDSLGRLQVKAEDAIKGQTIMNAFRLLANSKFVTIDQNYGLSETMKATPPIEQERLFGGNDKPIRECNCPDNPVQKSGCPNKPIQKCDCPDKERKKKKCCLPSTCMTFTSSSNVQKTAIPEKEEKSKEKIVKPEKLEQPEKTEKFEKPVMTEKCEKPENTEKPLKPEPTKVEKKPQEQARKPCYPDCIDQESSIVYAPKCITLCKPRELKNNSEMVNKETGRIGQLEEQVAVMRRELNEVRNELVSKHECMQYTSLEKKLEEINKLLLDMKENCVMSCESERYNSEKFQHRTQYVTPEPPKVCPSTKFYGTYVAEAELTAQENNEKFQLHAKCTEQTEPCRGGPCHMGAAQPHREFKSKKPEPALAKENRDTQMKTNITANSAVQVDTSDEGNASAGCFFLNKKQPKESKLSQTSPLDLPRQSRVPIINPTPMRTRGSQVNNGALADSEEPALLYSRQQAKENDGALTDESSFCLFCENTQWPVLSTNLLGALLKLIKNRNPNDVALTILLEPNNLYHINVALMKTGESIGCLYANEKGVQEANMEHVFEEFLTFFVVDGRNTPEQKNMILKHTFEFIKS